MNVLRIMHGQSVRCIYTQLAGFILSHLGNLCNEYNRISNTKHQINLLSPTLLERQISMRDSLETEVIKFIEEKA